MTDRKSKRDFKAEHDKIADAIVAIMLPGNNEGGQSLGVIVLGIAALTSVLHATIGGLIKANLIPEDCGVGIMSNIDRLVKDIQLALKAQATLDADEWDGGDDETIH